VTSLRAMDQGLLDRIEACGARVHRGYPLSNWTTFRLGGPCPIAIDCTSAEVLASAWQLLHENGIRSRLIGGGSNLLVSDAGVEEVVVRFVAPGAVIEISDDLVTVCAGAGLDDLAARTVEAGLDGLVTCSGIPGTVGGAIAGNAGAFGRQVGDVLVDVEAIDAEGKVSVWPAGALGLAYRRSDVEHHGLILLRARFRLSKGDAVALAEQRASILALRAEKHPDWRTVPTAGSFFKNIEPTSKADRRQAAGWYLEQAGAGAMREGGARTFERHANIVIAETGATAAQVKRLTDRMAEAVRQKFGLVLVREVKIIGPFA